MPFHAKRRTTAITRAALKRYKHDFDHRESTKIPTAETKKDVVCRSFYFCSRSTFSTMIQTNCSAGFSRFSCAAAFQPLFSRAKALGCDRFLKPRCLQPLSCYNSLVMNDHKFQRWLQLQCTTLSNEGARLQTLKDDSNCIDHCLFLTSSRSA